MIFTVHATFTRHVVATLEYLPEWGWIIDPQWCDMSRRDKPVDGYTFKAPGEWASAHRESLHAALLKLAERGEYTISIRGIRYLRRLRDDPVLGPQAMERSWDAHT